MGFKKAKAPRKRRFQRALRIVLTKQVGALPVIAHYLDRLGVAEIIDRACPVRDVAHITHGQTIAALVANRLTSPRPLYHVQEWAQHWAVEEVLDIDPEHLNDDRLGRALDAIFPHLEAVKGSVSLAAIQAFGIEAAVFHWDFTTLSFSGAYPEADQAKAGPKVARGHSKDGRDQDKQVQVGFATVADGAVPLHHTVIDGNAAEISQVVGALEALKKIAQRDSFLLVGDTKLVSTGNLLAACRAKARFVAPMPATEALRQDFLTIPRQQFVPLPYESEREQRKPEGQRSTYLGFEQPWEIKDKKTQEVFALRRLFIISSEEQAACRRSRERQMEKAEQDLLKLQRNAGTRYYPTADRVREKALAILRQRRVMPFYRLEAQESSGKVTFTWTRNPEALSQAEALDGFYVLVTNLPVQEADSTAVLCLYKGQHRVERRFGDFKGPLSVAPLFVQDNRRIAALVFVTYLALLVYCLLERQARRALADKGGKMHGLLPGGHLARPTGKNLLRVLSVYTLPFIQSPHGPTPAIPLLSPLQQKLYRLLEVPEPFRDALQ